MMAKGIISVSTVVVVVVVVVTRDDEDEDEVPSPDSKMRLFAAGSEDGMEDEVGDDPNTKC